MGTKSAKYSTIYQTNQVVVCDSISLKLTKYLLIIQPITLNSNQMLTTGIYPNKPKIAKVKPIFKKGDI